MAKKRGTELKGEICIVVLRLIQLRDSYTKGKRGLNILSVKYNDVELRSLDTDVNLYSLSPNDAIEIARSIGFDGRVNKKKKTDIVINGQNFAVRSMNYTDRPLINHSNRRKYEMACKKLGLDISVLDEIMKKYWTRRKLKLFNEDCSYDSSLNPFIKHKAYLKKLLTFMSFNSVNERKSLDSNEYVIDSIENILDYVNPYDDKTWKVYNVKDYFDQIWSSLCFSMRGDRGMPVPSKLLLPENQDLMKWVNEMPGKNGKIQYKGALHIRIKRFDSTQRGQAFEERFKEAIKKVKQNQGERDEYLLKLFLIECRKNKMAVPVGKSTQIVKSVGGMNYEYGEPAVWMKWDSLSAEELVYVCNSVKANKASGYTKADVFINGIGVSVKSERGAAPSLINHTTRDKILRVMKSINAPILPLDQIVDKYWNLRLNGTIGEDVKNTDVNSPFCDIETCFPVLKPLLNYFAFDGTGSRDSSEPAEYILSMQSPDDTQTWTYYSKEDFIDTVWNKLVFSLRSKSTPQELDETNEMHQLMLPWIKKVDGKLKGALSVRIC